MDEWMNVCAIPLVSKCACMHDCWCVVMYLYG